MICSPWKGTDEEFQPEIMKGLNSSKTSILRGCTTPPQSGLSDLPNIIFCQSTLSSSAYLATQVSLSPQLHQALFDLWAFTDHFLCAQQTSISWLRCLFFWETSLTSDLVSSSCHLCLWFPKLAHTFDLCYFCNCILHCQLMGLRKTRMVFILH